MWKFAAGLSRPAVLAVFAARGGRASRADADAAAASDRISVTKSPAGLVNSDSDGEFYTHNLQIKDLDVLNPEQTLWVALRLDAFDKGCTPDEHLQTILANASTFFETKADGSREVVDRTSTTKAIIEALRKKGELCMGLGGKSCGKTVLLKETIKNELSKEGDRVVLYAQRARVWPMA